MEVPVTGELETKLTHSAAEQGRDPDNLVQDVLTRYFEEEAHFVPEKSLAVPPKEVRTSRASPVPPQTR